LIFAQNVQRETNTQNRCFGTLLSFTFIAQQIPFQFRFERIALHTRYGAKNLTRAQKRRASKQNGTESNRKINEGKGGKITSRSRIAVVCARCCAVTTRLQEKRPRTKTNIIKPVKRQQSFRKTPAASVHNSSRRLGLFLCIA